MCFCFYLFILYYFITYIVWYSLNNTIPWSFVGRKPPSPHIFFLCPVFMPLFNLMYAFMYLPIFTMKF